MYAEEANKKYWARKSKILGANAEKFYSGDKKEHQKVSNSLHKKLSKSKALSKLKGSN